MVPLDDLTSGIHDLLTEPARQDRHVVDIALGRQRLNPDLSRIEMERVHQVRPSRSRQSVVGERSGQDSHR